MNKLVGKLVKEAVHSLERMSVQDHAGYESQQQAPQQHFSNVSFPAYSNWQQPTAGGGALSKLIYPDPHTGRLVYQPYNPGNDKIIDFSTVGYQDGRVALPVVEAIPELTTFVVHPTPAASGGDSAAIQQALDEVGQLPMRKDGFRGVVQLARGVYRLEKCLEITTSGTILQGTPDGGTVLEHEGTGRHLLRIVGQANVLAKKRAPIADEQIPVGATELHVKHAAKRYKAGDQVVVAVQFNATWVSDIGMDVIHPKGDTTKNNGWRPGKFEHLRTILTVQGDKVTLNSPLTTRLEQRYGGGYVEIYTSHRVHHVGIEHLTFIDRRNANKTKEQIMQQEKNKVKDYRFAAELFDQVLIDMDHADNCWIRQVTSVWWRNFIRLGVNTLNITLQQCRHTFPPASAGSSQPVTPLVGQFAFEISGQQILVEQCHAEFSFHAFSYKGRIPGPNVIFQCQSVGKLGDVGPHMKWSSGQLYDGCNFEGQLIIQDRFDAGSGHGWSGANSVVWNTVAHSGMVIQQPPLAQNFQIGSTSTRSKARKDHPWAWEESPNCKVHPPSLFLAQRADRQNQNQ
ncbi:hypothetical protein BC940DRAFT_305574 [Gongronella butleri]|nr:hypothetical protein BC940DRAFT_305574 [Gongronella butleri]